jgi:catechol 2,3-dioxygenase-like lactoylglutathione lyase family enzyme
MRVHISLPTPDLATAEAFYTALLGTPDKKRDDYLRFAPVDVPIVLSLMPGNPREQSSSEHFGLRIEDATALQARWQALRDAGVSVHVEGETECCYAGMSRAWVTDPMGTSWEIYQVTNDTIGTAQSETCCVPKETSATPASGGCCA